MKKYVLRSNQPARNPSGSSSSSSSTIRTYVRYRECEKNQAEHIGGHAVDGCREFMASGAEGTPEALICAACGCNRSYHRLEVRTEVVSNDGPSPPPPPAAQGAATAWAVNFYMWRDYDLMQPVKDSWSYVIITCEILSGLFLSVFMIWGFTVVDLDSVNLECFMVGFISVFVIAKKRSY